MGCLWVVTASRVLTDLNFLVLGVAMAWFFVEEAGFT